MQQPMHFDTQPASFPAPSQPKGSGKVFMVFLITGLVIFFAGGIVRSLLLYEDLIEEHQITIYATTQLLMNIGILIAGCGLSVGAFSENIRSERIRSTMLVAAGSCFVAGAIINIFGLGGL